MEQAMIPIRVSRLSDWKIYGSQWGHLRSTLDRCGVFFCRAGEVELEIDNTPYIIMWLRLWYAYCVSVEK